MLADPSHLDLQLAGRYQLVELIATGALARVYRGQDTVLRRGIAIKAVPSPAIPAYRQALQRTAALTHPAIVATYDAIEHDDHLFLIQEYVQARPFETYLRNGLPVERTVELANQLARVLAYAHSHGVIHGDLTPTALLVDRRATLRVNNVCLPPDTAYFARLAPIPGALHLDRVPLNSDGDTPATTAKPATDPTPADDIHAVGLIMLQALAVESREAEDGVTRIVRVFRPDVPENARLLVLRCLAQWDGDRIADAEDLVLALEALARELARGRSPLSESTPPALRAAREMIAHEAAWSLDDTQVPPGPWAQSSIPTTQPSVVDPSATTVPAVEPLHHEARPAPRPVQRLTLPSRPLVPTNHLPPARRPVHSAPPAWAVQDNLTPTRGKDQPGVSLALVIIIGILLFLLSFAIGFLGTGFFGWR